MPIKAVPRMNKVWWLQADADKTKYKRLPAPGAFGSTWHVLDEREKRRYTEQRVFGAAYGNAVLSDKALHYLDVLRPKYGELGLTFLRDADNPECKRSYLVLASHVRKYCTMMTVGTGKRTTEWERAGTLASCCHVLLALFEASGSQIKEVMQSLVNEAKAMVQTQSTKGVHKNTPKPSNDSDASDSAPNLAKTSTISGDGPVVAWQHRPATEGNVDVADSDWEAYPTSDVDLLEAAWSRKGTVQLGDARTVDLDTMTQSTGSASGAKFREVRRVVKSRQSATVAKLLDTAFAG